jgi:hypothetical protein
VHPWKNKSQGGSEMKKVIVLCFVVLVMFVPAYLFGGCAGDDMCTKPTEPDYYHIGFTLDGFAIDQQDIIFNFGFDIGDDPTLALNTDHTSLLMVGWYCKGGTVADFAMFKVEISLVIFTPGVYEGVYDGPSPPAIGNVYGRLIITEDDIDYDYSVTDGTLTITAFGNVGGDVVGTFNFTYESTNPAPSFSTPLTATGGGFRVLRIPDDFHSQ